MTQVSPVRFGEILVNHYSLDGKSKLTGSFGIDLKVNGPEAEEFWDILDFSTGSRESGNIWMSGSIQKDDAVDFRLKGQDIAHLTQGQVTSLFSFLEKLSGNSGISTLKPLLVKALTESAKQFRFEVPEPAAAASDPATSGALASDEAS